MWNGFIEFIIGKPKKPGEQIERENENWVRLLRIILVASAFAVVILGTRWSDADGWDFSKGLIGLLVAASALFVGGLLGFLFGIPRAQSGQEAVMEGDGEVREQMRRSYNENTNLEQISDWLTKIIVGVSLIQFRELFEALDSFSAKVGPAFLPGTVGEAAGAVAMAFLIFYTIHGFFFAYMWTRVYMIRVLKRADRPIAEEIKSATDEMARIDARALSIVAESLEYGDSNRTVNEAHLKELVSKASETVQTQIFLQAREYRKTQKKGENVSHMGRCIPVFEALISGSAEGFHRYHGQLAYALNDLDAPDYPRVAAELRRAIALRDRDGIQGYELYEMLLADVLVRQDMDFISGKKSKADVVAQVKPLIEVGLRAFDIADFSDLKKWRALNN